MRYNAKIFLLIIFILIVAVGCNPDDGKNGVMGLTGPTGIDGTAGSAGADGATGSAGTAGTDGTTAGVVAYHEAAIIAQNIFTAHMDSCSVLPQPNRGNCEAGVLRNFDDAMAIADQVLADSTTP